MIIGITLVLSAVAFGQAISQTSPSKSEKQLVAMSRALAKSGIVKNCVVATDGVTQTPSGLMAVAEVKECWDSFDLETPVVRIEGDNAVVTGRIVFSGFSQRGRPITDTSDVKIRYAREKSSWKFINLCWGACGSD
jgi:hypothetical protein